MEREKKMRKKMRRRKKSFALDARYPGIPRRTVMYLPAYSH
jgi:hypothetical protein